MAGREGRSQLGDAEGERHRDSAEEDDLAVAETASGHGRAGGRAGRGLVRSGTLRLDGVAALLPPSATSHGTFPDPRTPQAGELVPGVRLVVNFQDDSGWDHSHLILWSVDADAGIVLTFEGGNYAERFEDRARVRVAPIREEDALEVGSVDFSRGWTIEELGRPVRDGPSGASRRHMKRYDNRLVFNYKEWIRQLKNETR